MFDKKNLGVLAILLVVLAVPAAAAGATFFVTVEDSTGDVPDSGSIVIEDENGDVYKETDIGDGSYTFEGLEDGDYVLKVSSYGYNTNSYNISVDNGDVYVNGANTSQSSLDVTLSDAVEVTSNITVQSLADDEPIDNAQVELVNDGEVVESASTDENGVASITDYSGTYDELRVSADGYKTVTIEDYEFDGSSKTVPMQEGSDGLFGGDGSGGSSGDNTGLFVGLGVLIVLIGGAVAAARAE